MQLNCASFNKSMAPLKIMNSSCQSEKEFLCTLVSAGLTPEAICVINSLCRATASRLLQSTSTELSLPLTLCFYQLFHYFILSTSFRAAKIQADFSEVILYSLIQLTPKLFVSLGLHILPFHFSMYT